jgi:hypothetical protein
MAGDRMDERDELIERAARALRTLPSPNPMATARIVAAVRARRAHAPSRLSHVLEWMREPSLSLASAGFLAAAALVVGFVARGAVEAINDSAPEVAVAPATGSPAAVAPAVPVVEVKGVVRAIPVPIAFFEGRDAQSVAVVGDFNGWKPSASPMKRLGASGPWTATVFASPGRHVYAFLVDGTTLVADPRAPHARDLDYGGETSVLMVAAP